ncbi:hypothetical protein [Zoogloea sp.]|uniref:hypothetical protein n=1 Tax=Zoogloea sp. TaxID=49181 RepID=UPI0035B15EB1
MFDEYSIGDTRLPSPLLQKIPGNLQPFVPICLTRHASSVVRAESNSSPLAHGRMSRLMSPDLLATRFLLLASTFELLATRAELLPSTVALLATRFGFLARTSQRLARISGALGTSARLLATSAGLLASTSGVLGDADRTGCGV